MSTEVVDGVATVEEGLGAPQKASATQQPHSSVGIADTPESRSSKGARVPRLGVRYNGHKMEMTQVSISR